MTVRPLSGRRRVPRCGHCGDPRCAHSGASRYGRCGTSRRGHCGAERPDPPAGKLPAGPGVPARTVIGRRRLLTTTAAGVEWVLAGTFLGFRLLNVVQVLLSLPVGLSRASSRPLDLTALLVLAVDFAVVAGVVLSRGRFDDGRLAAVDVAVNVGLLASTVLFTRPDQRFDTWADWGYAVTLSAAFGAAIAFRRLWQTLVAGTALALTYLATTLPSMASGGDRMSAGTNAVTYVVLGSLVRVLAGYLRRLGTDADDARAAAAHHAARLERLEHQNLLHDQASVLALLSRGDIEGPLGDAARAQAAVASARIRAFLAGEPIHHGSLGSALARAAAEFSDLPLTVNIALATAELPAGDCALISAAVRTLLHNVRRHSGATEVVVHAVTRPRDWEVTVTDDGVGFDPAAKPEGYGLAQQVRVSLDRIGAVAAVEAAPGAGTTVRLTGPLTASGQPPLQPRPEWSPPPAQPPVPAPPSPT